MEFLVAFGLGLVLWGIRFKKNEPSIIEVLLDTDYEEMFGKNNEPVDANPYVQARREEIEKSRRLEQRLMKYAEMKETNNDRTTNSL